MRPTVRLFTACADVVLHVSSNTEIDREYWALHDCLHTVWMPKGVTEDFSQIEMYAYAQITDAIGTFQLGLTLERVDLANPRRNLLLGRYGPERIELINPWHVEQVVFQMNSVPFPTPGLYLLKLMEGGQVLEGGTSYIRVMEGEYHGSPNTE